MGRSTVLSWADLERHGLKGLFRRMNQNHRINRDDRAKFLGEPLSGIALDIEVQSDPEPGATPARDQLGRDESACRENTRDAGQDLRTPASVDFETWKAGVGRARCRTTGSHIHHEIIQ